MFSHSGGQGAPETAQKRKKLKNTLLSLCSVILKSVWLLCMAHTVLWHLQLVLKNYIFCKTMISCIPPANNSHGILDIMYVAIDCTTYNLYIHTSIHSFSPTSQFKTWKNKIQTESENKVRIGDIHWNLVFKRDHHLPGLCLKVPLYGFSSRRFFFFFFLQYQPNSQYKGMPAKLAV